MMLRRHAGNNLSVATREQLVRYLNEIIAVDLTASLGNKRGMNEESGSV